VARVRAATTGDAARMAELAERSREEYRHHAPVFHRPKPGASEGHRAYLAGQIDDAETHIALVHEADDAHVDAFLIAALVDAPPVYDPGGQTLLVDDFVVEEPALWALVGRSLLDAAIAAAEPRGAVQSVVVCGPHDRPKRDMLLHTGHFVASEWFTKPFSDS
jgi:GNAT superfamily N-acetyltransferase